jgi:hypothetical protein
MRTAHLGLADTLFLATVPAVASVIHFNLTGVVTSGSDNGYLSPGFDAPFGSPAYAVNLCTGEAFGSPIGRAFTLAITFDTSRGIREDYPYSRVYPERYVTSLPRTADPQLSFNSLTVSVDPSDAPEPSACAMLLLGLGVVGAATRANGRFTRTV